MGLAPGFGAQSDRELSSQVALPTRGEPMAEIGALLASPGLGSPDLVATS
jgi:hypothetical protein